MDFLMSVVELKQSSLTIMLIRHWFAINIQYCPGSYVCGQEIEQVVSREALAISAAPKFLNRRVATTVAYGDDVNIYDFHVSIKNGRKCQFHLYCKEICKTIFKT